MKVVLVCNSDLNGGAAVVTYRLMHALRGLGVEATMLVMDKRSDDPCVHVLGTGMGRRARFLWERACIFAHNGFNRADLFKVSIADTGYEISRHPLVVEADAVILSWVNQGMMSLEGVRRLVATGRRVIWVMHDMWCLTGACHHALDCKGYIDDCGHCRYFMSGKVENDLSRRCWERKSRLYTSSPSLTMVAVSSWLGGCARASSLLRDHDVRIIHNAFPDDLFYTVPRGTAIPSGVDTARSLIVMGAARLDDPIKGLPVAVDSLNALAEARPDLVDRCQAVFYGDLRDRSALDRLRFPFVHTGRISDSGVLRELFACATVVLSTSRFETLPGTIIEGMAAGCTPVTTGNGGQRDIVTDGETGYITSDDPVVISHALASALDHPFDRHAQHQAIASRFGAAGIAGRFIRTIGMS